MNILTFLNTLVLDNPFLALVIPLIIGVFLGDWIKAVNRFIRQILTSRSRRKAEARIKELEKNIQEAQGYVDSPQTLNHLVWYKLMFFLIEVSLSLFLVIFAWAGHFVYTKDVDSFGSLLLLSGSIIILHAASQLIDTVGILRRVKDLANYKKITLEEIERLRAKYPIQPHQITP